MVRVQEITEKLKVVSEINTELYNLYIVNDSSTNYFVLVYLPYTYNYFCKRLELFSNMLWVHNHSTLLKH